MAWSKQATLGLCLLLGSAGAATAQDKPAETTVIVTGKTPPVVRKIDGTVYDESKNPQAQTGTAADVLNTVPAVHVSPDGNVTLRGDSNVQVYVNGKPSAEMKGDSRALALQSMAGSDIASIEVITNPSAKYNADGSGIINIVLKKNRKPDAHGVYSLNAGDRGAFNTGLSGSYTRDRLSLHGGINLGHYINPQKLNSDILWRDPLSGASGHSTQAVDHTPRRQTAGANAGLDYDLGDRDTLSLDARYATRHSHNLLDEVHSDYDSHGALIDAYDRRSNGPGGQDETNLGADLDHRGPLDGEELKLHVQHGETIAHRDKSYDNIFVLPVQPDTADRILSKSGRRLDQISGDYVRPLGDTSQLSAGFDLEHEQNRFYNYNATIDPLTGAETPNPNTTNRFLVDQHANAAYVTWQAAAGKWTFLSGLRLKSLETAAHQITTGAVDRRSYGNLNPSLHLSYDLDARRQFKASFSQSLQRPAPQDLNPFMVYGDAQNVSAGNPALKPQRVTSAEVAYDFTTDPFSYSLTLYDRASERTVTDYSYFIAGDVLLTTKRNSGDGRSLGLDAEANGHMGDALSYSLDGNVFYTRLEAADTGGVLRQSALSCTAQASLDYDAGNSDSFSIDGHIAGKSLTSQGTRTGTSALDLSWRHKLGPELNLVVSAQDILKGDKQTIVTATSTIHAVNVNTIGGPIVYIGLSYKVH